MPKHRMTACKKAFPNRLTSTSLRSPRRCGQSSNGCAPRPHACGFAGATPVGTGCCGNVGSTGKVGLRRSSEPDELHPPISSAARVAMPTRDQLDMSGALAQSVPLIGGPEAIARPFDFAELSAAGYVRRFGSVTIPFTTVTGHW